MEQQKGNKKALKVVLLLLLTVGLVVSLLPYGAAASWHKIFTAFGLSDYSEAADHSPMSVHVLEVGKADSIFIECAGKYMLVDGGTMDRGEFVANYLNRRGVKKLDYVVNTHPDEDHIGGLGEIITRFPVAHYLAPNIPKNLIPSSEEYFAVQAALEQKKLLTQTPLQGDTFALGDLKVQVLAPVKPGNSTNDNSIVLRLVYGKTSFLLMGDAEKEEESDLVASGVPLSSDVLKVGHHGSGTSTTIALLNAVRPRYAAISVADDSNHLPNDSVLKRLNDAGAQIFRTDISGTLIFLSDGKTVSVITGRSKQ